MIQKENENTMDYYVHFTSAKTGFGIEELRSHLMYLQIKEQMSEPD